MKWSELRSKCRRKSDYIITLFITNEVSLLLTWMLTKTRVTPNHVTVASMLCGLLCGFCYSLGWFLIGSVLLFLSHVLDCTDGNLSRAKDMFSSLGKWLDVVGDRSREVFVFLGVSLYFFKTDASEVWVFLSLFDGLILLLYFYIVDIGLVLGVSEAEQKLTTVKFKGVKVKWGLLEPAIYGFIVLTPCGLLKAQIVMICILGSAGIVYQAGKAYAFHKTS